MSNKVTQFDLLVSCPGDITREIKIIEEAVSRFNRLCSAYLGASVIKRHWKEDTYPQAGVKPQDAVNAQIANNCEMAVALFGTRFGTPTDRYGSGTEEEIEEMIKSGKQVFLYFSQCEQNFEYYDAEQFQKVKAFRDRHRKESYYFTYNNLQEFGDLFFDHLTMYFMLQKHNAENSENTSLKKEIETLTNENENLKEFNKKIAGALRDATDDIKDEKLLDLFNRNFPELYEVIQKTNKEAQQKHLEQYIKERRGL